MPYTPYRQSEHSVLHHDTSSLVILCSYARTVIRRDKILVNNFILQTINKKKKLYFELNQNFQGITSQTDSLISNMANYGIDNCFNIIFISKK